MKALAEIQFASGENSLSVRHVEIDEAHNEPFVARVIARSPVEDLDLESLVGKAVVLRVMRDQTTFVRQSLLWTGIVRAMTQIRVEDAQRGLSTYRIDVVPTLWLLSQRQDNRLFQHVPIPTIVEQVLAEHGIQAEWRIDRGAYPDLELRVQYRETDLAFVSRLLEEAGIAYCFEQDPERGSVLVFDDRPQSRDVRGLPLRFHDNHDSGAESRVGPTEWVTKVQIGHDVRPGKHTLRDYDFRRPKLALFSNHEAAVEPEDRYEQYHYRPSAFLREAGAGAASDARRMLTQGPTPVADDKATARFEESHGTTVARIMQEAARVSKRHLSFESTALDMLPGTVFVVLDHPRPDVAGARLLVTRMRISGEVGQEFVMQADAVFADVPFRPAMRTQKPYIHGVQSAVVVGPENEEIYVDEFGRVRVQFQWDRKNDFDPDSSIWMRVSQGWAGIGYGMMVIPRIGHEVLVGFLDGDPDSPIIVGRVYNAVTRVPYQLPQHKTVSTWKSDSSPGSGGYNEYKIEDKKGLELVFEQAERDRARLVKKDEVVLVENDRTDLVQHNEVKSVKNDRFAVVHHDQLRAIGNDSSAQVRRDEASAVGRDRTTYVGRNHLETVGESRMTQVSQDRRAAVGNEDVTKVGNRFVVTVLPGMGESMATGVTEALESDVGAMVGPPRESGSGLDHGLLQAIDDVVKKTSSMVDTPMRNQVDVPLEDLDPYMPMPVDAVRTLARSSLDAIRDQRADKPTLIEMVNRRIRLTTGQASITLDGPDIRIEAEGQISILSRNKLTVRSQGSDVVVQGGPKVLLNPNDNTQGTGFDDVVDREGGEDVAAATAAATAPEDALAAVEEVADDMPLTTAVLDEFRSALSSGLSALLPEGIAPDLGSLRGVLRTVLDNVVMGRDAFLDVGSVLPGLPLPIDVGGLLSGRVADVATMLAAPLTRLESVGDVRRTIDAFISLYQAPSASGASDALRGAASLLGGERGERLGRVAGAIDALTGGAGDAASTGAPDPAAAGTTPTRTPGTSGSGTGEGGEGA